MNRAQRRRQRKLAVIDESAVGPLLQTAFEDATRHHQEGRLTAAEQGYRDILRIAPGHPDALHLKGVALQQRGDPATAEENIRQAIEKDKKTPAYHRSLGIVLQSVGRYDEAVKCFRNVVRLDPRSTDGYNDMGTAYRESARLGDAIACYRRALDIDGSYVPAHNNLGLALKDTGDIHGAISCFRRTVELEPKSVEAHNNLGLALQEQCDWEAAAAAFRKAIRLVPERTVSWIHFAEALRFARIDSADAELQEDIIACFDRGGVERQRLAVPAIALLRLDSPFLSLLRRAVEAEQGWEISLTPETAPALCHSLLLPLLWHALIPDADFELLLTRVRRSLLRAVLEGEFFDEFEPLLLALSAYCFANEFVFATTDAETGEVDRTIARLADMPELIDLDSRPDRDTQRLIALIGCYRPLHTMSWADRPGSSNGSKREGAFADLIRRQVLEPCEEARLRDGVERLGSISDAVSKRVREQYEQNPYPRWRSVNAGQARPLLAVVRQLFPYATDLPASGPRETDILIAGCGTGHTAIQDSYRFTEPRILAVDLSLASLTYAMRQSHETGGRRIDFVHGDILDLGGLGRDFDFIEAAGVLHHMDDPLAGWEVLTSLLRPGGFMKVGLYSQHARRHVIAAQSFAKAGGYPGTPEGIRRCRADIIALPGEDAARAVTESLDFHAMSPCRDLMFHVQERCYVLPEIAQMLEALGLRFIGFELRNRSVYAAYREWFPEDEALSDLSGWDALEAALPDTFAGMYQFWVRAGDR